MAAHAFKKILTRKHTDRLMNTQHRHIGPHTTLLDKVRFKVLQNVVLGGMTPSLRTRTLMAAILN